MATENLPTPESELRPRIPSLQEMCTSVAAQALARPGRETFALECRAHLIVVHQIRTFEMLRRTTAGYLLEYVVHRCPELLTDELAGLVLGHSYKFCDVNLSHCTSITQECLVDWSKAFFCKSSECASSESSAAAKAADSQTQRIYSKVSTLDISNTDLFKVDNNLPASTEWWQRVLRPLVTSLIQVNVSNTAISDRGVEVLLTTCTQLQELDISHCQQLTNSMLDFVRIAAPVAVSETDDQEHHQLDPSGMPTAVIAQHLRHVLAANTNLGFRAIRKLALMCQDRLETVDIGLCEGLLATALLCLSGYVVEKLMDSPPGDIAQLATYNEYMEKSGDPCLQSCLSATPEVTDTMRQRLYHCGYVIRGRAFTPNLSTVNISAVLRADAVSDICAALFFMNTSPTLQRLICGSHSALFLAKQTKYLRFVKDIDLFGTRDLTLDDLVGFCTEEHHLQHLNLVDIATRLNPEVDIAQIFRMSRMPWLSFKYYGDDLSADTFADIIRIASPTLERLQLAYMDNIPDDVLCLVLKLCRSVKVLELRMMEIGPEVIDSLLHSCPPRLTELSLPKGSPLLLNEHVAECVAQSCPLLEKVNLSWHTNIGNAAVRSLLLLCPMLRILEVTGVKQLTSDPFLPLAVVCKTSDSVEDEAVLDSKMMALVKHNQQYYVRRSTVYGRNLQLLDLRFCDHVDVEHLMTIARATFQSLNVRHFKFDRVTEGGEAKVTRVVKSRM
eukprot:scpid49547/ scgid22167/ 